MKNAAQRIHLLFLGSETYRGTHGEPDLDENGVKWNIKRTARTLKGGATEELWTKHLEGKQPLGVIPIKSDSTVSWGCIDVDDYDVKPIDVIKRVDSLKMPLVPCRSKSGGLHLFMFFSMFIEASIVQAVLKTIAAKLGFAGSEIFPKQTKLIADKGDQGNWMVMPYFGGDYGGKLRMQYGLKKTGAEMTVEEFLSYSEKRRMNLEELNAFNVELGKDTGKASKGNGVKGHSTNGHHPPFHNGPPCLQHMATGGFPDGGRNNALFHIGVFLRRAHPDDWQIRIEEDNTRFMKPPLPYEEVRGIVRSLTKKDYEYKCKDQPMASHCDSVKCRSRKFGIGPGGSYPMIEELTYLKSDPPIWFAEIPGGGRVVLSTDQLTSYRKFHNACVAVGVCFRLVPDPVWVSILGEAMQSKTIITLPDEVGRTGQFEEHMQTFLTNRAVGEKIEDLLRHVPWEDEGQKRYLFSMKSLESFLLREKIRPEFTRPELAHRLRDMKGTPVSLDIMKQRNVRLWQVPIEAVAKAPELAPPNEEVDHI